MSTPEQLKTEGLAHFQAERLPQAAAAFAAAAEAYRQADAPATAAEMLNNLAVVRLAEENWEAALAALAGTPDTFLAAGDRLRQAQAIANLAAAHEGAGRLPQAIQHYEQAIDLLGELGEKENRAACYKRLSGLQVKQGKQLQALASMQSGLSLTPNRTAKEQALKGMLDKAVKMIRPGG